MKRQHYFFICAVLLASIFSFLHLAYAQANAQQEQTDTITEVASAAAVDNTHDDTVGRAVWTIVGATSLITVLFWLTHRSGRRNIHKDTDENLQE